MNEAEGRCVFQWFPILISVNWASNTTCERRPCVWAGRGGAGRRLKAAQRHFSKDVSSSPHRAVLRVTRQGSHAPFLRFLHLTEMTQGVWV